jgi:hypothetical protein
VLTSSLEQWQVPSLLVLITIMLIVPSQEHVDSVIARS